MKPFLIDDEMQKRRATNFQTTLKLIKICLGSGIFAIPYAYSLTGIFWGILMQLLICMTQFKSWIIMINCIGNGNDHSLITYIQYFYGKKSFFSYLIQIMTVLLNFGCGVSYIILFTITIKEYFSQDNQLICNIILFFGLFILYFSFSFGSNVQIFAPILKYALIIVYLTFIYLSTLAIIQSDKWSLVQVEASKAMIAFGIMIFAYDMNGVITEIRSEMEKVNDFPKCLFFSMMCETVLYMFFGITCSLLFQNQTNQAILINFREEFKSYEGITITFSILIITYVSILQINNLMCCVPIYLIINQVRIHIWRIFFKILYLIAQLLTAFLYPNFAIVLSIAGCVCVVILGYVTPFIMTFRFEMKWYNRLLNTFVVLFGVVGGVFGIIACF